MIFKYNLQYKRNMSNETSKRQSRPNTKYNDFVKVKKIVQKIQKPKPQDDEMIDDIKNCISDLQARIKTLESRQTELEKKQLNVLIQDKSGKKIGVVQNGVDVIHDEECEIKDGCTECHKNPKAFLDLNLLKSEDYQRHLTCKKISKLIQKNRICKSCSINRTHILDPKHKFNYCMLCRSTRSIGDDGLCNHCKDESMRMQSDHSKTKKAFEIAIGVIAKVVDICHNITFKPEYACNVRVAGNIDMVMDIVVEGIGKKMTKLVFVIEFQNTHHENVQILTHKFLEICESSNTEFVYLMNVRISHDPSDVYAFKEKMDIFRRWIIFVIYNYKNLPLKTYWEFFQGNSKSPFNQNDEKSPFLNNPIKIEHAPANLIKKCEWQFASDPYAGHVLRQGTYKNKKLTESECRKPWNKIVENAIDPKDIFGINFPKNNVLQDYRKSCSVSCDVCAF